MPRIATVIIVLFIFLNVARGIETHFILIQNLNSIMLRRALQIYYKCDFVLCNHWRMAFFTDLISFMRLPYFPARFLLFCDFLPGLPCYFYCSEVIFPKQANISCT